MKTVAALVTDARTNEDRERRHEAFAGLVRHFHEAAYAWAYHTLGDGHLAQDAVQEAFVVAYQKLHQLRDPKAFAGWFQQIVRRQSLRLRRGPHQAAQSIEAAVPAPEAGPAQLLEAMELNDNVMAAIQSLPEHEQKVTEMFYFGGYSQKEIARLLELPLTTVKKRLQYARGHLKLMLAAMFAPAPEPTPIFVPARVSRRYPPRRR